MYEVRIRFCHEDYEVIKPAPDDVTAAHEVYDRWVAATDGIPSCNVSLIDADTGYSISFTLRPIVSWEGWTWNQ